MKLAESLNRTMKLAMDDGRVQSYQEAVALFSSFRLRLQVAPGFTSSPGVEAAVLTLLRAGPKTFLGGIELFGPLDEPCTLAWFAGKPLGDVAAECGVNIGVDPCLHLPTICVGPGTATADGFWIGLRVRSDGFGLNLAGRYDSAACIYCCVCIEDLCPPPFDGSAQVIVVSNNRSEVTNENEQFFLCR